MTGAPSGRDEQFVLAVDLGTGGPKVGLVSLVGRIVWHSVRAVETRLLPDGGAVQDAEEWWQLVVDEAREGLRAGIVAPEQVVGVSCTGQWASTVPVDADGRPVAECSLWMDSRGAPHSRRLVGGPVGGYAPIPLARWVRRTAGAPSTNGADPIGHMLHYLRDRPEVASAARWFLEPIDYLSMRFTGIAAATHASMAGAWLTDNRRLHRMEYDADLVRRAGLDLHRLPPLQPVGSVVGPVTDKVAAELGLPNGVPVIAGTPDLHSAAVGAGAVLDYDTHLAISTTSWIGCPVSFKKTDAFHAIATVPGIETGQYLVADNHETAGLCLQWLRDQIVAPDDGLLARGSPSFDALTDLAAGAPVGSGDVIFTPWLSGERSPIDDRNARGGFHNVSLSSTRAHFVRAVLEGVAYNSKWLHDTVERFVKRRLDNIRFIGGGAQSDLWCQIHADVMDRTIERVAQPVHANLRGAAILAGMTLGDVRTTEVRDLVTIDATSRLIRRTAPCTRASIRSSPSCTRSRRGCSSASTLVAEGICGRGAPLTGPALSYPQRRRALSLRRSRCVYTS